MLFYKFIVILLCIWNQNVCDGARVDPVVETNQGFIRGLQATDGNYSLFLGIPYGKVDESNPFGPSVPHPKFETVFDAVNEPNICPQRSGVVAIGSLDCLQLNVFVPHTASTDNPLPVLIYIHGGRLQMGSSRLARTGPKYLVRHDIILVTLNYRVGPYGFMCLDTPEVPGNAGLKDQLLALKWIKENIAAFGGDANKITLSGQSAGGFSVDFQFIYNKEIYFHQIITQSGNAKCPAAIIDSDRDEPIKLAELIGYNTTDLNDALSFLSRTDPALVIIAKQTLGTWSRACVEKYFEGVDHLITDHPMNMPRPRARTTPILSGYTEDEMSFEFYRFPTEFFEDPSTFPEELTLAFQFGDNLQEMGEIHKHFYVGETMGDASKLKIIQFLSDYRFNHPTQRTINAYLENGAEKIYHYLFTYIGGRNLERIARNITLGGATHSDELGYLFDIESLRGPITPEDELMIDRMTMMWANFVKYGDPTPETTELLPVKWTPVTNESLNYLEINSDLSMNARPFHQRLTFWDYFYDVNERYSKWYKGQG